ncbi:MAG: DUF2796 domain-containing protein [Alphaproteobacteria bacterium]|nr:DUF2796 domain-containing protein [Alphaproteobacteria bacterium]
MTFKKYLTIASALTLLAPTFASAETARQHDAHEHGVSQLKIALDGNLLQFELEAPGADIVGFEHAPEDEAQKKSVQSALALLKDPANIFELPKAANCSVTAQESAFETEHEGEEHDEKEHDDAKDHDEEELNDEEGHAEFHVSYSFTCTSPQSLANIGLKFFTHFSEAEELEVEAVSNNGQFAAEIMRDETSIDLSSIIN